MKKAKTIVIAAVGGIVVYEVMRKTGLLDRIAGEIKVRVGTVKHDPKLKLEGLYDKGKGYGKKMMHDTKEALKDVGKEDL